MTPESPIVKALAAFDNSPTALAGAIGGAVKRQNVEYWLAVGRVPVMHRPAVERAAQGVVTCEELSDDGVHWMRIRDKTWPWHKSGRPYVDATAPVKASA